MLRASVEEVGESRTGGGTLSRSHRHSRVFTGSSAPTAASLFPHLAVVNEQSFVLPPPLVIFTV